MQTQVMLTSASERINNEAEGGNKSVVSWIWIKLTHPPTPVVLSLEYGALSGSIAVTSCFLGSFYYSPDDKVFPSQVFLEERRCPVAETIQQSKHCGINQQ